MNTKQWLKNSILAAAGFLGMIGHLIADGNNNMNPQNHIKSEEGTRSGHPNILFIITDQWNPKYFSYAGHPVVKTPNIDKLVTSGINFSRMYTSQPLCMPSRATIFTGLTPRGHKVRMNGIPLDRRIPTFTEALRKSGYHTHCVGKIHLQGSVVPTGDSIENISRNWSPDVHQENGQLWRNGRNQKLKMPYYGFSSVDYSNGHGHNTYGDYYNWLKTEHPEEFKLFVNKVGLTEKSPASELYNRNSYKWALPADLHPTVYVANKTIQFLNEKAVAKNEQQPFFLKCSIADPHPPFAPPAPYCFRYKPEDVPEAVGRQNEYDDLPPPHFKKMYETAIVTSGNKLNSMKASTPYRKEMVAHYYGLIEMIDDQIGRIMNTLEKSGMAKNTIVIFTSDHGDCMGDHGLWGKGPYHYDGVIRVPFIVSFPGKYKKNIEHDGPVEFIDIAPTILDMSGVPIPEGMVPPRPEAPDAPKALPGRSLVSICTGEDTETDTEALVEMDEDYLGFKMRTLVTKQYRLTIYGGEEYGELFDLKNDPDELINLWNNPEYKELIKELKLRLMEKIIKTDISTPKQISRA